jgi:16S rRNA (uracil1498-N3)-methyltransferase
VQVEWQGPKWEVLAACFSLKGGRADWLVEKCTELGAWGLRPMLTIRSPHLGTHLCSALEQLRTN